MQPKRVQYYGLGEPLGNTVSTDYIYQRPDPRADAAGDQQSVSRVEVTRTLAVRAEGDVVRGHSHGGADENAVPQ